MKQLSFLVIALAAVAAILTVAEEVQATANCQPTSPLASSCQGFGMVGTTTGGVASGRCFAIRTTASTFACSTGGIGTTQNEAWELDAGACITVYYYDVANGATPPAVPNKVNLQFFFDGTATLIKQFLTNAAEPANGSSYSFCATSDGNSGSSPRAGVYFMRLNLIKDNGPGGVGNYNIATDGGGSQDTSFDYGYVRARTFISSIARNAYPAGSTFAYGPSGDEIITITSTFTQPAGDANLETVFNSIVDAATLAVGQVGATVDVDATTTLAQNFVADNTFPAANSPYVPGFTISGNSAFGVKWTVLAASGHGSGLTRVSDTFIYDSSFNIDSRIRMDSTASGGFASADETDRSFVGGSCSGTQIELFNRGEMACTDWAVVNARDEYLSRAMTFARRDTANTVCASYGSVAPTANIYTVSGSFSTGATCIAAADATGTARHLLVTNTDQSYTSGTIYKISSQYFVDSHIQVASTLVPDDYPTDDAGEYFLYLVQGDGMGGDMSDTIRQWCHVDGVRHDANIDTTGSAVTGTIKDPTAATRATDTTDTGSDGWTPTAQTLLASSPIGDSWTALCSVAFNGNTGTDTETFEVVTPAGGGGGETLYVGTDPLKVYASPVIVNPGENITFAISASFLDGTARTGAASAIFVKVYDTDQTLIVNNANPTEIGFGSYKYAFTPSLTADAGGWTVLINTTDGNDTIGTSNTFFLESDGNVEPVTAFETATSTSGIEFLALFALVIIAIILWSRSTDYVVKVASGVLCFIAAVVWILLITTGGSPFNQTFKVACAVVSAVIGGYLIIRAGIDRFQEGKGGPA